MPLRIKSAAALFLGVIFVLLWAAPGWIDVRAAFEPVHNPVKGLPAKKPTKTPTRWPTAAPTRTPRPTATATATQAPIILSTPRPDGSVIHVVEAGQVMWSIAMAYEVSLADIYALNGMTESTVLYPGDKLLVKPAERRTATPATAAASAAPTLEPPTPTQRPTRTLAPAAIVTATRPNLATPTRIPVTPDGMAAGSEPARTDPLLIIIGALVAAGSALVLLGAVFKKK